jgi:ubiquinone/menaquinone biosynthesis C-methylase UbiE
LKDDIWGIDGYTEPHAYAPVCLIADAEYLPFQNQTIPAYVSNFVLEHSANPIQYLKEAYRTMKPGGLLIISVPTSYWHLGNTMSIYYNFQYLLKIIHKPSYFLKNPLRHFIMERSHEKDHALDSNQKRHTLLDEIRLWKIEKWEAIYRSSGFNILDRSIAGHLMSTHHLSILAKLPQPSRFGVHCTHVLGKE